MERLVRAEIARISRLIDDLLLLAKTEQTQFLRIAPIDSRPTCGAVGRREPDRRAPLRAGPSARGERCARIPTASPRRCATCWATRSSTPPPGTGWCACVSSAPPAGACASSSRTTARASPSTSASASSTASTAPTRRATAPRAGTGLGLAIVRAIAEAHGGTRRRGGVARGRGARRAGAPGFRRAQRRLGRPEPLAPRGAAQGMSTAEPVKRPRADRRAPRWPGPGGSCSRASARGPAARARAAPRRRGA